MQVFQGNGVTDGVAVGRIFLYKREKQQVKHIQVKDAGAEAVRFHEAMETAGLQLQKLYEESVKTVGESGAAIFEMHRMMLQDDKFVEAVEKVITTRSVNAEYAVASVSDTFIQMFSEMEDAYMRERAADVKDIAERMLRILGGGSATGGGLTEPSILLAEELSPSETAQLEGKNVLAFVTAKGTRYSHTAILAKTFHIPALVGTNVPVTAELDGKMAVVDGKNGILYIEPDEEILAEIAQRKKEEEEKELLLQAFKGKETVTPNGRRILLYANIGSSRDLEAVLQNDAEGIGLFRSEFLYLEKQDYPTEEEQFAVYKKAAKTMAGKKVIIRTLDIGADKQVPYFGLDKEENPAMGFRAIRICLSRPELFKTQLRAIYRASAYGNIAVMYPMIISAGEVRQIRAIVEEVKKELAERNIPFGQVEQGVMIETPAAVMVSEELAKEVDFFSIGTNDLTQYTLAIDRQNPGLDAFYDAHHPAILRMIEMVVANAHKAGIRAGICGELGADMRLIKEFLKMGVDEISVAPDRILPIRKAIRETNFEII